MATLKKYDYSGKEVGEEIFEDEILQSNANSKLIKDYIVAIRHNQRQWSANTKVRKEVNHSNQKPHKQKGLGRARQGSLAAPQYKGGGIVFGPKPKFEQHVRINKKERRAANRFLLNERILENKVLVLRSDMLAQPKTKLAGTFLKALKMDGKRVLILSDATGSEEAQEKHKILSQSVKNIKKVGVVHAPVLNGYDLVCSQYIVIMDYSLDGLKIILGKK